ncbi:MAG: sugar transferase, partial [Acidobacteria bacterium]|nr:sugar transferase [Acidobacteriota bacterium]
MGNFLYPALKRMLDLALSFGVFALLSIPMLVIAILVRITSPGPALFRQLRPGQRGRPFTMLKFRTMTETRDVAGNLLPDADRLNRFGRFLRSSSLDELPELVNVLK